MPRSGHIDHAAPALAALLSSCMPPPVRAVDGWLEGYAAGDVERVLLHTASPDRGPLGAALAALETAPTSTLALAVPPRPVEHEILEIEEKDDGAGRCVVLARVTMKNPLPFAAERVGHALTDVPRTRGQWRRFLAVREGDRWGVKLDLAAVLARMRFARTFEQHLRGRRFEEARAMLSSVPPPPDDGAALSGRDRLAEALRAELEGAVP